MITGKFSQAHSQHCLPHHAANLICGFRDFCGRSITIIPEMKMAPWVHKRIASPHM